MVYHAIMHLRSANTSVRPPAVAGLFYPDDAAELRELASGFLRRAPVFELPAPAKALIVPHAGYVYSGAIAASAYALIASRRNELRRVVLIGPSHRVYLQGIAVPSALRFATPLGTVAVDPELKSEVLKHAAVIESDVPHQLEHSLEVQLPFLQLLLGDAPSLPCPGDPGREDALSTHTERGRESEPFTLLPLVLGSVSADQLAAVLDSVWGDRETVVLVSSDLSHYHSYEVARQIDAATSAAILRHETTLSGEQACGAVGINGLLHLARQRGLEVTEIARCNSGDTAADRTRVVGYGAFALH